MQRVTNTTIEKKQVELHARSLYFDHAKKLEEHKLHSKALLGHDMDQVRS